MNTKYGLPAKAFDLLMKLDRIVPPLHPRKGHKKKPDLSKIKQYRRQLSQVFYDMGTMKWDLASSIKAIIANGWPQQDETAIRDRYRKSKQRKSRPVVELIESLGSTPAAAASSGALADHALTEGTPRGPKPGNRAVLVSDAVLALSVFGLGRDPYGLEDDFYRKFAKILAKAGNNTSVTKIARYFGAYSAMNLVADSEIGGLYGVHVYVPLDCSDEAIAAGTLKVVNQWRQLRVEKSRAVPVVCARKTDQAKIEKLRALPDRIRRLLPTLNKVALPQFLWVRKVVYGRLNNADVVHRPSGYSRPPRWGWGARRTS